MIFTSRPIKVIKMLNITANTRGRFSHVKIQVKGGEKELGHFVPRFK